MRRVIAPFVAAVGTAIALASAAHAVPDQGTPAFNEYMQGLERNGYHLNPDTAWPLLTRRVSAAYRDTSAWRWPLKGSSARERRSA